MAPDSSTTETETVLPVLCWAWAGAAAAKSNPSATTHPFVRQRLMEASFKCVGPNFRLAGRRAIPQRGPELPPSRALDDRFSLSRDGCGRAQGGQELPVDAPEAAVGEDHDPVPVAQLAGEVGDDVVHGPDEPRVLASRLHGLHEVVFGEPLALRHLARQV